MTQKLEFQCRSCRSESGSLVLDLGLQPLANNLLKTEDLAKVEPRFPLRLAVCQQCWLLQIVDLVPPVQLFSEYLYFSSFSDSMLRHASAAVAEHVTRFGLNEQSRVVEIASNDGYLLRNFVERKIPCLGIEPARNIAAVARERGIETVCDFFSSNLAARLAAERGRADLILGNNVFAHVPETNDFVSGLKVLLNENGCAVLEFPYGMEMIEKNEFDTIYHEHVFYFSLAALVPLFERHGLEIFDVQRIPIHGGSLRLFAGHAGCRRIEESVSHLLQEERGRGVLSGGYYEQFAGQVEKIKQDLCECVSRLRAEGQKIAAYGASAKGSTLLNYVGLDSADLLFVADRSSYKQGRLTPGTHIPIVAPEMLVQEMPSHTLLLTWNFADEILEQQSKYRNLGGKFIVPIPCVQII